MIRYNIPKHSSSKLPKCNILPVSSQDIKLMWVIWYVNKIEQKWWTLYVISSPYSPLYMFYSSYTSLQQSFVRNFICHIYRKQIRLSATYLLCQGWDLAQCAQVWTSGIETWPPQKFYYSLCWSPENSMLSSATSIIRHFYYPPIRQKVRHTQSFLDSSIGLIPTTYRIDQIFLYSVTESNIGIICAWEM